MFLLDTNVVSEMRSGKSMPSNAVRDWAFSIPRSHLYLAAVSVLELECGVLSIARKDEAQARILRSWLDRVLAGFAEQIIPFTADTALLCAPLHVPNRRPERDAMIAATAKEHGYTVVTRNTRDFEDCGVQVLNPWL